MASQATKKTAAPKTATTKALEAEATKTTELEIEFRGEKLKFDRETLDDYEMMEMLANGMPFRLLNVMVPDAEQRTRLLLTYGTNDAGRPKLSSAMNLVQDVMEVAGAGK